MDCSKLKEELYKCLSEHNLGYDIRYLKSKVKSKTNEIKSFQIDSKILEKCSNRKFAECLEQKYSLQKINEQLLYEFYQDKYDKLKLNREKEIISKNKIKVNSL